MARTIKMNNKPPTKARKSAAQSVPKEREAPEVEDEFWREVKPKAEKKKEEAAAKRAEARRLAELEETILEKSLRKVTEAERRRIKEEEEARKAEEMKTRSGRTVPEKEYESIVAVKNMNRQVSMVDARSLEEALAQLAGFEHEPHIQNNSKQKQREQLTYNNGRNNSNNNELLN